MSSKTVVKYFSIFIDKFVYFKFQIKTQIKKSSKTVLIYKSIFYSKHFQKNCKILLYKVLIRPIAACGFGLIYHY